MMRDMTLSMPYTTLRLLMRALKPILLFPALTINIVIPLLALFSYLGKGQFALEETFFSLAQTVLPLSIAAPLAYTAKLFLDQKRYELLFFYSATWHLQYMVWIFTLLAFNTLLLFTIAYLFIDTTLFLYVKILCVGIFLLGVNALLSQLFHSCTLVLMFDVLYILANYLVRLNNACFPFFYSMQVPTNISLLLKQLYLYLACGVFFFWRAIKISRRFCPRI